MTQPITLYSHQRGPNPWKVALILEELQVPYKHEFITKVKEEPYISVNPNGRVPAIHDPNTGLTLWESGAIIEYLVDQYDTDHKISFADSPNRYLTKQWLYFQASGQGPYYGQAYWFNSHHPEKLQSAIDRYLAEIRRVTGVLDGALAGKEWLVGDKCTYADLSFVAWQRAVVPGLLGPETYDAFPNVKAWLDRLLARETAKKIFKDQEQAIAEQAKAIEEQAKNAS